MFFVALCGIDASGKDSHTRMLREYLSKRRLPTSAMNQSRAWPYPDERQPHPKLDVHGMSFPNYDSITGRAILAHLKSKWSVDTSYLSDANGILPVSEAATLDPLVFQCLQTNNRFEGLPEIFWQKPDNTVFVADRYHASALVYGSMDGLPMDFLDKINRGLPMPDLYILLDISVDESKARRPERRDRYEADFAYLERVRQGYLDLFKARGWRIVNGAQSVEAVHEDIVAIVNSVFPTVEG